MKSPSGSCTGIKLKEALTLGIGEQIIENNSQGSERSNNDDSSSYMDDEELQSPTMQVQENICTDSLLEKEDTENGMGFELSINEDNGDTSDFFSI